MCTKVAYDIQHLYFQPYTTFVQGLEVFVTNSCRTTLAAILPKISEINHQIGDFQGIAKTCTWCPAYKFQGFWFFLVPSTSLKTKHGKSSGKDNQILSCMEKESFKSSTSTKVIFCQ